MGRMYAVSFTEVAVTVAVDVFELTPADDKPLAIHGIILAQSTDVGDVAEEIIPIRLIRGFTSSGSGGSVPTPVPLGPNDTAAGFTAETNNTTGATTGTTTDLLSDAWNIRVGYQVWFPPEARPMVSQANTTLVLRLASAPADSIDLSGTIYVEELN